MSTSKSTYLSARIPPLSAPVVGILVLLALLPIEINLVVIGLLSTALGVVAYYLNNYLITTLTAAFVFRIGFIAVDSVIGFLPSVPISEGHNQRAIALATAWADGQFVGAIGDVTLMRVLMAHLLAPFYLVLGSSEIAGRVGIAFLSLFVGYLVFKIARRATDRRTSVLAATAVLFWPTIVYRSVIIQREIVIVVVLLAFLWAAIQWLDEVTPTSIIVAVLSTVSIFALRKENLVLIAAVVGCLSLIKSRDKPYYLGGLVLLAAPFFVLFALYFERFTGHGTTLSPAALDAFAYGRAHGDAAYLLGLHYESWIDVVLYAPIKVLYFLFTPFPWHVGSLTELFVGVSALALLVTTLFARRGIAKLQDKPYYLSLLLSYLVIGVVTYSIIEMNYGAAVRRRIQFIPIIVMLAVIGIANVKLDIRWPNR